MRQRRSNRAHGLSANTHKMQVCFFNRRWFEVGHAESPMHVAYQEVSNDLPCFHRPASGVYSYPQCITPAAS